ncbi:MAG: methyltransferase domain-containing protein [Deltaproteobacteria bacterium]|nr:methyltransferase domain-containing protein [Deltaproteobacteria bacterium]
MSTEWDPDRYLRFAAERRLPYEDLVAMVEPAPDMRVADLGCGPGALTADLATRFDARSVLGIDASDTMLAKAAKHASTRVRFERGDLRSHPWGDGYDLVFSNAALHWLPDHDRVWERLRAALSPRGQLAVQMPANFEQPTHTIAAQLAGESPFAEALGGRRAGAAVDDPEAYAVRLHDLGFRRQVVRQAVYLHVLPGPEAALEWVRGSMLTWYRTQLGDALFERFEAEYATRLLAALPDRRPLPFTYRRILMWASLATEG